MTRLAKEYKEKYRKELETMSFEKLIELKDVLIERQAFIEMVGAVDEGIDEKLKMVEKAIERADIMERVQRILCRA